MLFGDYIMCNNFAHLHQHTTYSFLDGAAKIKDLIEWVKATSPNNPTVAVTDHGSLHSVPEFYKTAIKNGVKPIIGFEPYVAVGDHRDKGKEQAKLDGGYYHLTLLAENFEGYQNLARLSTLGYTEGFYKKPRISLPLLSQYKKGIICLSGCLGAEIPRTLLDKGFEEGEVIFKEYFNIFRDKFFVELQNHRPSHAINPNDSKLIELVDEQTRLNQMLRTLALKYGVGMVATNDGHYVKQEDAAIQEALLAVQTKTTLSNPNRWKFACDQFYVKSPDEMAKAIPENEFEGAISNTMVVADMCNVELPIGSKRVYHMPSLELEASPIETVRRKAYRGARERYSKVDKALRERIEYELSVIEKTGFPEYFLVLEDAISWAKSQGIRIGLARGSAAASVVCYCLGIINLDPIRWNLYFERFLNEHRISQPDIDLDIQDDRREELVNYLREKYGHDKVSYIGTFGQMSSKAAIKDAARVLEVDWREAEKFTKLIPSLFGNVYSIDESMEAVDELKEMYNNGAKEYVDLARKMEGLKRQAGIHAAGVIISDIPITDLVPLFRRNDVEVSQYDMNGIEDFGFVKMDFLGLRTLSLIQKTMDWIGQEVDMPLNDKKAMQIFCDGKTTGIFQMESAPMTDALMKLQPRSVEALFALNALYRPGPMDYLPTFIKRYRGEESVEYKDFPIAKERLAPILEDTMGLMCIAENQEVITSNGLKLIQDVDVGDFVLTEDGSYNQVLDFIDNGTKETIEVRCDFGRTLRLTSDHKVLTQHGWKEARDLSNKDLIKSFWEAEEKKEMGDLKDWFVGLHLADGNCNKGAYNIACSGEKEAHTIKELADKEFSLNCRIYKNYRTWYVSLVSGGVGQYDRHDNGSNYQKLMLSLGLKNKTGEDKFLPENSNFATLMGFIDGDGSYINNRVRLRNKNLALSVYKLMQAYRIKSSYFVSIEKNVEVYVISFSVDERFYSHIGKKDNVRVPIGMYVPYTLYKEEFEAFFRANKDYTPIKNRRFRLKNECDFIGINKLKKLNLLDDSKHNIWAKVLNVQPSKLDRVYDLSVENNHSFVVSGLVVHNCYQEQVMEICVDLASYTNVEADIMRKIIGKKQVDKMPAQKEKFVNGCVGNGIPKREAEKLFSTIEKFAAYSFNLGHSTAYGLTAYQTAYLKAHYPTEFMAAFLTTEKNNTDKLAEYAKSAAEVGVQVLPPDINKSYGDFTPVDGEVRWGLNGIKNVGKDVVEAIIEERKKGLFSTFEEFCFRMQEFLNKRSLEYLIKAGCFDKMSDKQSLLDNLDFIVEWVKIERIDNPLISIDSVELTIQGKGTDSLTDLFLQKEAIGMFINGHPNHHVLGIRESRTISVRGLRQGSWWISGIIENITKKTTRSGKTMAILTVSDETGSVELVAYSDTFDKVMEAGENTLVVLGVIQKNSYRGKQTLVKEVVIWKDRAEQGLYVVNASDVPKDVAAHQQDKGSKLAIKVDDKWLYETDYWINTSSIKGYYVIDVKERVINEW